MGEPGPMILSGKDTGGQKKWLYLNHMKDVLIRSTLY